MWNTIAFKKDRYILRLQEKMQELTSFAGDMKERYQPLLMRCAAIFMIVKIGLIFLTTFFTMAFIILSVTPRLDQEMSRTNAFLLALPLTFMLATKIYFIGTMLMTYDRSRCMIQSALGSILFRSRQGLRQVGTFRSGLPLPLTNTPSLQK
ncbi:MAG: hypothetical protein ACUBOA_06780 [Candidatus Loosdrechtia sp.]|uniref:hypothetical protein n=1 Tax=Candidatus Loosdrechtia sp. TaxID=3101272 RepID=UPI003A653463|nr:MAG: hypothetical protein QY305_10255 [Candidatus Jettenia sp. AMX2]